MKKNEQKNIPLKERDVEYRAFSNVNGFKRYSRGLGVYVIRNGEYYKIGYTFDILTRLETFKTSNPNELKVILWMQIDKAKELESALHKKFENKRHFREWFKLEDSDIGEIIRFSSNWWLTVK